MYKSKDQLLADGYTDFQYFGRSYIWFWIGLALIFYIMLIMTIKSIAIPDYAQDIFDEIREGNNRHNSRGVRTGLGLFYVFIFFLAMPIFVKILIFVIFGTKFVSNTKWGLWNSFDHQPDLALGPNGLYFPQKYQFEEISWEQITKIYCERKLNLGATKYLTTVTFLGWRNDKEKEKIKSARLKVLFRVPRRWGMDGEAIIYYIQENVPHVNIEIVGIGRM